MTLLADRLAPFGIVATDVSQLQGYDSENYRIDTDKGSQFVLKLYSKTEDSDLVQDENRVLSHLKNLDLDIPQPFYIGDTTICRYKDGSFGRLLTYVKGQFLSEIEHTDQLLASFGKSLALLDRAMKDLISPSHQGRVMSWDNQYCHHNSSKLKFISREENRSVVAYFLDQYLLHAVPKFPNLRRSLIHNDFNNWNVLTRKQEVTGVIDFADMSYGPTINNLAVGLTYILFDKVDPVTTAQKIISAYHAIRPLQKEEVELLYYLIGGRLCTSLCHSAEKKVLGTDTEYTLTSERPAQRLLKKWLTINPVYAQRKFLNSIGIETNLESDLAQIKKSRDKHIPKVLSLSYDRPIYMRSAAFQYMYDEKGNTYLDAYNNIPHVGHCHPDISQAISRQARTLNTNSRYYYRQLGSYAERLLSYFPRELDQVFFVNSGSAATDLATRLAENFTGQKNMVVLDHGYHGNTSAAIDLSDYKFSGSGGSGKASHITILPLPKLFGGKYCETQAYIDEAIEILNKKSAKNGSLSNVAAFIAEPISGCGGQVPIPPQYIQAIQRHLDQHKSLTIVDEVQVGFGRLGDYFWGFEYLDIIPDIVVLGKPIGNGHPMAAVVTRKSIAQAFDNGMEFFSSFGSNPVSCEVGMAVLDIIEGEHLQRNAKEVGDYFTSQLRGLAKKYSEIGDVRGVGLFLGFELVQAKSLKPNKLKAQQIKNQLRDQFVLSSTDGPHDNVVKIKPPLCFNRENVDEYINKLDRILA